MSLAQKIGYLYQSLSTCYWLMTGYEPSLRGDGAHQGNENSPWKRRFILQIAQDYPWNPDEDYYYVGAEALFRLCYWKIQATDDFFS